MTLSQEYFNYYANYFGINRGQTGTKCMLVCAGPIAGPLAGAASQLFFYFCLSAHAIDVFQLFFQLFWHK